MTANSYHAPNASRNNIVDDDDDDTSNSQPKPPAVKAKKASKSRVWSLIDWKRKYIKRNVKIIVWAFDQPACTTISLRLWMNFCNHTLRKTYPCDQIRSSMDNIIVKLQCTILTLGALFGDLIINHVLHIFSWINVNGNKQNVLVKNFWKTIVDKWRTQSKNNYYHPTTAMHLPQNKSNQFINVCQHPLMLRHIWRWISSMHDMKAIGKARKNHKLLEHEIVVDQLIFWFELAQALWECYLCSHSNVVVNKRMLRRPFTVSEEWKKWIHGSYRNANQLPYSMMYDAVHIDSQQINHAFKDKIPTKRQTTLPLKVFCKTETDCMALLDHLHHLQMIFVIFYPLISTFLKGNFEWDFESFHKPLQDCKQVIENLGYAHYWQVAHSVPVGSIPESKSHFESRYSHVVEGYPCDPPPYDYVVATSEKRLLWKVSQIVSLWIFNLSRSSSSTDLLLLNMFPMLIKNKHNGLRLKKNESVIFTVDK